MDKKYTVFRYIAYSIEIVLLFILQTTPFLLPEILGSKPILLIPVAFTIAFFEKEIPAMFFGMSCGIFIDLSCSNNIGFYAFSLTLVSFIISQIFRDYVMINFINSFSISSGITVVLICVYFILFYLCAGKPNAGFYFTHHYISKIVYTICMTPVLYVINKFLYKNLRD